MTDITWTPVTVKLKDLKPWEDNPRMSSKKQANKLLESWKTFGQVETLAVSPTFDLYNGHQRCSALLLVYGGDYEVDARQSSRPLTDEERRKLVIFLHAGAVGAWDWDRLSAWQPAELMEFGFDTDLLRDWKRDVTALGMMYDAENPDPFAKDSLPNIEGYPVPEEGLRIIIELGTKEEYTKIIDYLGFVNGVPGQVRFRFSDIRFNNVE